MRRGQVDRLAWVEARAAAAFRLPTQHPFRLTPILALCVTNKFNNVQLTVLLLPDLPFLLITAYTEAADHQSVGKKYCFN